jgi:hypothetical protein
MSRSLDQSRPFRAGRHRADAAPVTTTPPTHTSSAAIDEPIPGPAAPEPASSAPASALRRRRNRRPAFEVPPAPEAARHADPASPATEALPVAAPLGSASESAPMAGAATMRTAATRRAAARTKAVENQAPAPRSAAGAVAAGSAAATAPGPQAATDFSSDAPALLKRAAAVRVMGHRMAVVTGALAVVLAVGTASQATELPFFGKEASAQDTPAAAEATRPTLGTQPTSMNGRATPRPTTSTPPGTPGAAPAQGAAGEGAAGVPAVGDPAASALPAIAELPMPVDAPTLAGIVAASPAAVPPSSGPSVQLEPPVISSAAPAASPAGAAPAPAPPAPAPTPTPTAVSPAPSPTATATADGTLDEAVDTRSYASARLAAYGWGAEQMDALNLLWDTSTKWRPSQVDRGLSYIKERYGSPAKAAEFRAANNWY